MQLLDIAGVAKNYDYEWPGGDVEKFPYCIDYEAVAPDGKHQVRIGFGQRETYGQPRKRVVGDIRK